jgi:hypothetical protein
MCPGVWPRGCAAEGVSLGIRCGEERGDPGVEEPPLGENLHLGRPDGWGSVLFVGRGPQQIWRVLCGAESNGCGGAVREAGTPIGTQLTVGEEPPCGLGWVRLWYVRFRYVRLV